MSNKTKLVKIATPTVAVDYSAQLAELSAAQEISIRKIEKYSEMFSEISSLISKSGLPDRLTFRTILVNWKTVGALIEAIIFVIRRFKTVN